MAKMSWQYVAGFFDGEGTLCLARNKTTGTARFTVSVGQSKKNGGHELLSEIRDFLVQEGITIKGLSGYKAGRDNPMSTLSLSKLESIKIFLEKTFPYLRVKKVLAQDWLRYLKLYPNLTPYRYEIRRMLGKDPSNYRGEKVYCSKLKASQIPQIRTELNEGHGMVKDIAARYGVAQGSMTAVKVGRSWKGIPSCL